jgi:hypothetical protein
MNKEKAITYSLLAHIRNSGTLAKGPIDIFTPLIKRVLSKMNIDGVFQGKSISEIKERANKLYKIDFPIPVLKKILQEICKEVNTDEMTYFVIHKDNSFSIKKFTFIEFEEIIENQTKEIDEIEELFKQFCNTSELKIENSESIFKFIEKSKFNLSKYLSDSQLVNGLDYTIEAQFVNFFKKIPVIYDKIKNIYLGSIIAGYIEYNPDGVEREIELLFDTNFIVGLLDLNTPESTHTCRTLLEIAKQQKFKIRILQDTIQETKNLLNTKADFFDKSFLQKKVNPEDVYNACDRKKLNKSDLERIGDNLEKSISEFGISVINTEKLKKEAQFTDEYKKLIEVRNSKISALHDATAILHINQVRKNKIKEFDKVNAWFVNNSISNECENIFLKNGFQPETIKADDLLNILWLSNPIVNKRIKGNDLAEIGLTSIISLTLNSNLPKSKILSELDDNIHKYAKEEISDSDIIRVATRITNKQLRDIEELNELADKNKEEFVKRLEEEANKQKRIEELTIKKLESIFLTISKNSDELENKRKEFLLKSEGIDTIISDKKESDSKVTNLTKELLNEKNAKRKILREAWIETELKKWRYKTWKALFISIIIVLAILLYYLNESNWDINQAKLCVEENIVLNYIIGGIILTIKTIIIVILILKYANHSNINSYITKLKVPEEMQEIKQ